MGGPTNWGENPFVGLCAAFRTDKAWAVTKSSLYVTRSGMGPILSLALLFFATSTWASYLRWANFEYRTFDLAYYVQSIWQLIHGRFQASVEGVPLLGNHVEPIIL